MFISGRIAGYELRSSEGGEREGGEGVCECQSLILEVTQLDVYQLREEVTEFRGQLNCNDTHTLSVTVMNMM